MQKQDGVGLVLRRGDDDLLSPTTGADAAPASFLTVTCGVIGMPGMPIGAVLMDPGGGGIAPGAGGGGGAGVGGPEIVRWSCGVLNNSILLPAVTSTLVCKGFGVPHL